MLDLNRFPMDRFGRSHDTSAKMLADGLMAKANAKDRHFSSKSIDRPKRDSRAVGRSRTRRDQDLFRSQFRLDLVDGDLVISNNLHIRPQLTQILDEVVGERVVIVYNEQHTCG